MTEPHTHRSGPARRDLLRLGLGGLGLGLVGAGVPLLHAQAAASKTRQASDRILVVVELSGANDGLNTVVPYADDAYHRARPRLALKPEKLLKIDDRFGFHPSMPGFERLYKNGQLAVVNGVGYEQPSFSHFTSMAYWHTAAPNRGEKFGWLGQLADTLDPGNAADFLVNVQPGQSLAVRAHNHVPLVFDSPGNFTREGDFAEHAALTRLVGADGGDAARQFMTEVARSAQTSGARVREACAGYRTPVEYGLVRFGLERVAALINAGFGTRLYYVSYPHNAFDTHVYQADTHARLLRYTSDHIAGFLADMKRIGRADDVALLVFSEFGRRVGENANAGTDHGTAGPVFMAGAGVKGGLYGAMPDLTALDDGNMRYNTDFRRVYASAIREWMRQDDVRPVLKEEFAGLGLFA